jgi:hypothetical protein
MKVMAIDNQYSNRPKTRRMSRLTVVIKRNAKDEDGMFGLFLHDESGGLAKVQRINSEAELRTSLLNYGVTDAYAEDILSRLKTRLQSVEITVAAA